VLAGCAASGSPGPGAGAFARAAPGTWSSSSAGESGGRSAGRVDHGTPVNSTAAAAIAISPAIATPPMATPRRRRCRRPRSSSTRCTRGAGGDPAWRIALSRGRPGPAPRLLPDARAVSSRPPPSSGIPRNGRSLRYKTVLLWPIALLAFRNRRVLVVLAGLRRLALAAGVLLRSV